MREKRIKLSRWAKDNDVSYRTAIRHYHEGKIEHAHLDAENNRIYVRIFEDAPINGRTVIYGRVSTHGQKEDLERQVERLKGYAISNGHTISKVYTDIGSGLDDGRRAYREMLLRDNPSTIIVEHRDRLTRFGFSMVEALLEKEGRKVIVVDSTGGDKMDLVTDFYLLITSFCGKLYGARRGRAKNDVILAQLKAE